MKHMVFIYSPIFLVCSAYYDYSQKILINERLIEPVDEITLLNSVLQALTKVVMMCCFTWVMIDRELVIFFESQRNKR